MSNSLKAQVQQKALTCPGHTRPVVQNVFNPEINDCGYFLISACKDGKPMLRAGDTGDWVGTFIGHKGAVWSVALNRDATLASSGAADFSAKIWDSVTGEEKVNLQHNHIVKSVAFDHSSRLLLTGTMDKSIRVYDIANPESILETYAGHSGAIKRSLFCKNDKWIVSCAEDKSIKIWDRTAGNKEVMNIDFPSNPSNIEISHDGSILIVTYGNTVGFYELETMNQIKEIECPTKLAAASLHPDKDVFVCAGEDFKVYKFNFLTGTEIESFKGHFGPVHTIVFSPDGELYASGSEDGTVRLWQTTWGKNYGLWRVTMAETEGESQNATTPREIAAN